MYDDSIAIKAENLGKKYILNQKISDENGEETSEFWALKDICFEIKKGESVAIIGTNGSGKSTLLKILAGVTKPSCGSAILNGRVASILDIGAGFHPELSGKENIFLNGQLLGFSKKEIAAQFDNIVRYSEIEKFINQPVKNYSSGMYLRLAFSILANLNFDIYLLDEVLNVGDANFQLKVKQFIQDKKNKSATFIFVSHDLNTLTANCSKFYLLDNGKIINKGNADIIEEYLYKSLLKSSSNQPINIFSNDQNPLLINDFVTLKKISVDHNQEGFVLEDEPVKFSCLIEIKKATKIDIAFGIENLLGNDICYVSTLISDVKPADKNYNNELVEVTAQLPQFTIKKGNYILKINLIINDDNPIISQFKAFQFTIIKGLKKDCEMIDQRPNTAIIHGEWSFNKTF
jgi:lipopolysaccharide transport system ATP-binding protein